MKSAHSCRVCGRWLEGDWNMSKDPEERDELERQMQNGHCDNCDIYSESANEPT